MPVLTYETPMGGSMRLGLGFTAAVWRDVNVNDLVALDAIDITDLAEQYGLRQTASLQVVSKTGTAATRVVKLRWSNDGGEWSDIGSVAGGATHTSALNVKGVRLVRPEVTTAEGSAATADVHLVLTGDYR